VQAGSGYLSASSRRLHFGLGDAAQVDQLEIYWPSGQRSELRNIAADRLHSIVEGSETRAGSN